MSFPLSSPSERGIGASRDPSSIFTLPFDDMVAPPAEAETFDSAGRVIVAVESAWEMEAEGARMLIFLDLGFLVDGLGETN